MRKAGRKPPALFLSRANDHEPLFPGKTWLGEKCLDFHYMARKRRKLFTRFPSLSHCFFFFFFSACGCGCRYLYLNAACGSPLRLLLCNESFGNRNSPLTSISSAIFLSFGGLQITSSDNFHKFFPRAFRRSLRFHVSMTAILLLRLRPSTSTFLLCY